MDVAGARLRELVSARNFVFDSGKVAPAGEERSLVCVCSRTVAVASSCSGSICVCAAVR